MVSVTVGMRSKRLNWRSAGIVALSLALFLSLTLSRAGAQTTPKTLLLGAIGIDTPTERGVQLAVARFNARGNTVTPDGAAYQLAVQAVDANTPDEVSSAITQLKQAGAVAIFGPERDDLVPGSATTLLGAGIPVFTSATSPAVTTGTLLFRTRADDSRMLSNLTQFVTGDLAKSKIALYQGDSAAAPRVTLFTTALTQAGKTPATTVIQVAGGKLSDSAKVLISAQPEAIAAFGVPDQAAQLLRELRGQGFNGLYIYPDANDPAFVNAVPDNLRAGIIGVANWVPGSNTTVSAQFVRDYVALFDATPTARSAAAYDAAAAAIIAIARNGVAPDKIAHGLLVLPRAESIQGHYNAALGNNELSADVTVFTTNDFGAPSPSAQFDETGRLALNGSSIVSAPIGATAVPQPSEVVQPTQPVGVVLTAKSTANVRSGPGTVYGIIGKLKQGDTEQVIGVSPDNLWLVINFAQQQGWVSASLVDVVGNLASVPVINPPPTPTLPPTATPAPQIDLIGLNYVINPAQPKSGQPFTVSAVIRNQGGSDAGAFAVATSFLPGNVYSAQQVPGLAAGQTTTVNLKATVSGPGTYTVQIVLDLNKQLNWPNRSTHGTFPVTYTVVP
ncbi:MAG: ABC transporter substrate-binding protein [Aggregatilineales bacterium]